MDKQEINTSVLIELGWKKITIKNTSRHYQIQEWLKKYCEGKWCQLNDSYLFENEKDATIFNLRWT